jgi:hypothetical protein
MGQIHETQNRDWSTDLDELNIPLASEETCLFVCLFVGEVVLGGLVFIVLVIGLQDSRVQTRPRTIDV